MFRYRPLQSNDMERMLAIFNQACAAFEVAHIHSQESCEHACSRLSSRLIEALVCEDDTGLAGWMALTRYQQPDAYHVTAELWIYVDASRRRLGIGSSLARRALQCAQTHGVHSLVLLVLPDPAFVLSSAKAMGFVEQGRLSQVFRAPGEWKDIIALQYVFSSSLECGMTHRTH